MTLAAAYDGFICDLDGVVYRGRAAVPHAVQALISLPRVVYATNNASRTPDDVAGHLHELGIPDTQVVTSSTAAADVLAGALAPAARVLAVGGAGLHEALRRVGLISVRTADDHPVAVVQGLGMDVTVRDLAEAAVAIHRGAQWVATNTDLTLPTDRGLCPGNGALIGAVARAVGRDPDLVIGKPARPLYDASIRSLGVDQARVLAIGDRLDTDIAGAQASGIDSLWVMTGVDDLRSLACSDTGPTFAAADLRALHTSYPEPDGVNGWAARAFEDVLTARERHGVGSRPAIEAAEAALLERPAG